MKPVRTGQGAYCSHPHDTLAGLSDSVRVVVDATIASTLPGTVHVEDEDGGRWVVRAEGARVEVSRVERVIVVGADGSLGLGE
jgi:hypothetical protein